MRISRKAVAILALAAAGLLISGGAFAQNKPTKAERREEANSRAVQGAVVLPDDKPAAGAVVQLKDMRTLQVRSFITLDDGLYHFSGLRADIDYQVTAKSGDMSAAPRTLSIFDNRKDAVMNFKLEKK
jgi:hypothetical protein